ncbi:MAG: hypothetical protein ABWX96_20800 [Propionibacteriaceae bacterium]
MYDMYPEAWPATDDRRRPQPAAAPRRRTRKAHSVVPAVIALGWPAAPKGDAAAA